MKILLVCAAGMSTSLVVEKMKKALSAEEQNFVIEAHAAEKFADLISSYDVALLGPQIKYKKTEFDAIGAEHNVPVELINTMDYGLCKGDKILKFAKDLVNNK